MRYNIQHNLEFIFLYCRGVVPTCFLKAWINAEQSVKPLLKLASETVEPWCKSSIANPKRLRFKYSVGDR